MDIKKLINTFFILILFMLGNYLIEFFPRQLHKFLLSHDIMEHLVLFFLIYFSMELRDTDNLDSPFQKFYESAIIYVFYIFFSKSTLIPSIITISLLAANYIIISQQQYLEAKGQNASYLNQPIEIISWIILAVMIISFIIYLEKQIRQKKDFNIYKFIFNTGSKSNRITYLEQK